MTANEHEPTLKEMLREYGDIEYAAGGSSSGDIPAAKKARAAIIDYVARIRAEQDFLQETVDKLDTEVVALEMQSEKAEAQRDQAIAERDRAQDQWFDRVEKMRAERDRVAAERDYLRERQKKAEALHPAAPDRMVPAGWALVPIEPTPEFYEAYLGRPLLNMDKNRYKRWASDYRYLLAAAPPPPDVERQS